MSTQAQAAIEPVVGEWYEDPLKRRFEVVSLDEEAGLIRIQYHDGDAGELGVADWRHAMMERVGSPEGYMTSPDDEEA